MTLKLSAMIAGRDERGAVIAVCVNGEDRGALGVNAGDADELVALLNAAGELLELCGQARDVLSFNVSGGFDAIWRSTVMHRLKVVLAKAKGTTC